MLYMEKYAYLRRIVILVENSKESFTNVYQITERKFKENENYYNPHNGISCLNLIFFQLFRLCISAMQESINYLPPA